MQRPSPEEFRDWQGHPVTEWIMGLCAKWSDQQQGKWAEMAWQGNLDPLLLTEARTRADCYRALPESSYEDWEAIDDSET